MTMPLENKILALARNSDINGLVDEKTNLVIHRMKLDRFFSLYLDKFDKKMDPDAPNTPIWNLYKTKLKEYEEVERCIKLTDYYMKKGTI